MFLCQVKKPYEFLRPSTLEKYEWPLTDPHTIKQPTRQFIPRDINLVKKCLESARIKIDKFQKEQRKNNLSDEQIVLSLLSHKKFQMNPVEKVRSESEWLTRIRNAMANNRPIEIVYPLFCCIPNAPKRYTNIGPAAGEDCTIEFFKLINEHVKEIYPPGVIFHVLSDASLYASAFQTPYTEVKIYYEGIRERIKVLGATEHIKLYDYEELLRAECYPDYMQFYYLVGHAVWTTEDLTELLPSETVDTLRRSIRTSVNTRRFQLTHHDHLQLFGPPHLRMSTHPFFKLIENLTDIALREFITIRIACENVKISDRLWPNAIRATCHRGPKNERWALGLRPYPEYLRSSKLLPYHGMPLITYDENKKKLKLEILPEVMLRGRLDLIRIVLSTPGVKINGESNEVYAYIEADIDA